MSGKGENKKAKAISMPKAINVSRKNNYWIVQTKAGPYTRQTAVPLGVVLRDYVKVVPTMTDAKHILNNNEVTVNGVVRNSHQFPVGLFDVIAITKQKLFVRVVLDTKERLVTRTLDKEAKEKASKITTKVMTKKGVQITTNDGRTFLDVKANVGDSVLLAFPKNSVSEVLPFKEGMLAYIAKGAHCSQVATIKEIVPGTQRRDKLVKLTQGKEEFETIAANVMIIGKTKSAMGDLE